MRSPTFLPLSYALIAFIASILNSSEIIDGRIIPTVYDYIVQQQPLKNKRKIDKAVELSGVLSKVIKSNGKGINGADNAGEAIANITDNKLGKSIGKMSGNGQYGYWENGIFRPCNPPSRVEYNRKTMEYYIPRDIGYNERCLYFDAAPSKYYGFLEDGYYRCKETYKNYRYKNLCKYFERDPICEGLMDLIENKCIMFPFPMTALLLFVVCVIVLMSLYLKKS